VAYRYTADQVDGATFPPAPGIPLPGFFTFVPDDRSLNTVSGFVQDTVTIVPDRFYAMVGTKLEHNDYTGVEVQPSGRVWWTPDERQTLWAAISRPVRTPSRIEDDFFIQIPPPPGAPLLLFRGNRESQSEELVAYEAGYRRRITDDLSMDLALFFNDYHNLIITRTISKPGAFPILLQISNGGEAESYGGELAGTWRVADNWTLRGSYSVINLDAKSPSDDNPESATPMQQAQVRSTYKITSNIEFDSALYYVDNIPARHVPHYERLDLGVTWRVTDNFELAVWGQNLLDPSHPETSHPGEVQRGGYVMGTVRF
jgi:iron complex outermembrane receptor protein